MRALIDDKEATEHVFHISDALSGDYLRKHFDAFVADPRGASRLAERRYLPPLLDDHEALLKLPEGTVGREYVAFMRREGLTAQGLVDEFAKFAVEEDEGAPIEDDVSWYGNRTRDTHDLMHVLTGYGRDALGEASLLAFTSKQNGGFGIKFIAWVGAREIKKSAPPGLPLYSCIREGARNGGAADWIMLEDIPALLREPLESARERIGIQRPETYLSVRDRLLGAGLDPDTLQAGQAPSPLDEARAA